ncbi:MAG: hypothetical protein QXT37_11790 [Thermofilaceae archaeon]
MGEPPSGEAGSSTTPVFAAAGEVHDPVKCEYLTDASACRGVEQYEDVFSVEALARCYPAKLVKIFVQNSLLLNRLLQGDQRLINELFPRRVLRRADLANHLVRGS